VKTKIFVFLLLIAALPALSQNYQIVFSGSGQSSSVDSVKVENLSQCTTLLLSGSDTLNLVATVGTHDQKFPNDGFLSVFPNPSSGKFNLDFEFPGCENVNAELIDGNGSVVLQRMFPRHLEHVSLFLDRIPAGLYLLKIEAGNSIFAEILISTSKTAGEPYLVENVPSGIAVRGTEKNKMKFDRSITSLIPMQFNEGDTLKLTGKSGIFRTVKMLIPDDSQRVDFNFMDCTDADNNHYAVVQIGDQLWMQENLKTTRYRDGSVIPNVTDSAEWANQTTGAWCDYHNLPEEGAKYGHLYNFYAASDTRDPCPAGWHMATQYEWNLMEKFLDSTVDTTALGGTGRLIGRILKEGCDTRWQYMDTTYGFNSAGFTALCANFRSASGGWSLAPDSNHDDCFWTATFYNPSAAWSKSLRWCYADIFSIFPFKRAGCSARCIKDN
jgi:uncharacterized protein (TIGR02145 family)